MEANTEACQAFGLSHLGISKLCLLVTPCVAIMSDFESASSICWHTCEFCKAAAFSSAFCVLIMRSLERDFIKLAR